MIKNKLFLFTTLLIFCIGSIFPCSGINKTINGVTLVGGNEDWLNPHYKLVIDPGVNGDYGTISLLNSEVYPVHGVNETGLTVGTFNTPVLDQTKKINKGKYKGNLVTKILKECNSLHEALALLNKYDHGDYFYDKQLMITDKSGDSAIIEGKIIHRKDKQYQVVTNFHISNPQHCNRFITANRLIDNLDITISSFENILNNIKQSHLPIGSNTMASYIVDQSTGELHLYLFGDFSNPVTLSIQEELNKGYRIIEFSSLFKPSKKYNDYLEFYLSLKPKTIKQESYTYYDLTGTYMFSNSSVTNNTKKRIFVENEKLFVSENGVKYELFPFQKNNFYAKESDLIYEFIKDKNGNYTIINTKHIWYPPAQFIAKLIPGSKYDDYEDDDYIYDEYNYDDLF